MTDKTRIFVPQPFFLLSLYLTNLHAIQLFF